MRALAASVLALLMTNALALSAPLIARITNAPCGGLAQAYGEGFLPGQVEVRAQLLRWPGDPRDKEEIWRLALESAQRTGFRTTLPAIPPPEAGACRVVDATSQVVAFAMPSGWGSEVAAVWLRNAGEDWSEPYLVNLPEPWWLDLPTVETPHETARLYGRRLTSNRTGAVVLRRGDHYRRAQLVNYEDVTYFSNPYRVGIRPAKDTPSGDYEVWLHNGGGGDYGWVKVGKLSVFSGVRTAAGPRSLRLSLRDLGAKGDGVSDDTAAFEKAFARSAPGGVVLTIPPGEYLISRCLRVPPGFSLCGAGTGATTIVCRGMPDGGFPTELEKWEIKGMPHDWYPFVKHTTPLVWLRTNSSLSDLAIENRGDEGVCVLVANPGEWCDDIAIRNCRIRNQVMGGRLDGGYNPSFGCIWVPNKTRRLVIADNTLETVSSALVILSRAERAKIARNQMHSLSDNQCDLVGFRGGLVECVIEDNRLYNSKRGMTMQQPHPALYYNYFARNTQEWVDRGGNANETLLMEGWHNVFCGAPSAGTSTTITVAGAKWQPGEHRERYALVVAGRGLGQYGRIADNTADTVRLASPWRVTVDETTTLVIGEFFAENIFLNQNDRRSGAAFQFWGNCLANTVEGLHAYQTEGVIFWAVNSTEYSDSAPLCYYNEVANSYLVGMGHVEFRGAVHQDAARRYVAAPVILGNAVRDTAIVDYRALPNNQGGAYWKWYRYWMEPFAAVDFWATFPGPGYRHADRQPELHQPDMPPAFAYNVIDGCLFQRGARGGRLDPGAYHTVFYNTTMDGVTTPFEDQGEGTVTAP